MLWALHQHDPKNWLAPDKDEMHAIINIITGPFKYHLDRYKYASRYEDTPRPHINTAHRAQALEILHPLQERLAQHAFLMGDTLSLADIATFPFLRQFANTQPEWWQETPLKATQIWLQRLVNAPLFTQVMTKHAFWKETP